MSPLNAIKTFRDLLSFLTIIPVGGKEDFIFTTAKNMYLFPVIGCFIGLLGGLYFLASSIIIGFILNIVNNTVIALPIGFLTLLISAAMTVAFLLVLTGLQHFDGLIDLGNAIGLRSLHDRKMKAHEWTVTSGGAILALAVEFLAVIGLFLVNPIFTFPAIILAEVSAKLAMVTIVWVGKPSHKGLGSIFLAKAKKKLNIVTYALSFLMVYPILYFMGFPVLGVFITTGLTLVSIPIALIMSCVANKVFGGVSGDMIGATNEMTRTTVLLSFAIILMVIMP